MKTGIRIIVVMAPLAAVALGLWWVGNFYMAGTISIHELAANGDIEELSHVLRWRPERAHELDRFGRIPLHAAATRRNSQAVQLLLDAGSLVSIRDRRLRTPLHEAAHKGPDETIFLIIQAGAEVNLADIDGWTPLFHAATNDRPVIARALIEAGANVNLTDNTGDTALDWALVLFQHQKAKRLLRENGARTRFELEREQLVHGKHLR